MFLEKINSQSVEEKTEGNGSSSFEMDLYTLQFRWIPSLIDAVVNGHIPCQALVDVPWWKQCLTEQGMTGADFSFEEIRIYQRRRGRICLTFPYPKYAPLAKYAVIDISASGQIAYYTLEMSLDNTWVLGSQDVHKHSYIRQVPDCPTMADFERDVDRPYNGRDVKLFQLMMTGLLIILVIGILTLLIAY